MATSTEIVVAYDVYDEGTQRRCTWAIEAIAEKHNGRLQSMAWTISGGELILSFKTKADAYWFVAETGKFLKGLNVPGKAWTLKG